MKGWGGTFLCALACLLCAGSAADVQRAQAKPRFEVHERSLRLTVWLKASNGYEGWIATEGHKQVTLFLAKGKTAVEARTTGRVTRKGIDARFGELGRVSVRFRGRPFGSKNKDRDGERRCRGRKPVIESGRFSGTIEFRGENGFTQVDSKSTGGFMERLYRRVCRPKPDRGSLRALFEALFKNVRVTILRAHADSNGTDILFQAAAVDLSSILGPGTVGYTFSAQTVERSKGVRLTRRIGAEGDEGSFLFGKKKAAPRRATVTPPRPFTGTAQYLEEPGLPRGWTGSLSGRLPGAGLVAMTGSGFRADTCRTTLSAFLDGRCSPESDQTRLRSLSSLGLDLPQGSGSQSQAFWDERLSWSR